MTDPYKREWKMTDPKTEPVPISEKTYAAFGRDVFKEIKETVIGDYWEIDMDILLSMAVKHGLATLEPYDPDEHGEHYNLEEGDNFYTWE